MRYAKFCDDQLFVRSPSLPERNLRKPIGTCDSQFPIPNYQLPITNYQLPITNYRTYLTFTRKAIYIIN